MTAPGRAPATEPPDLHALADGLRDLATWAAVVQEGLPPSADSERRALAFVQAEAAALLRSLSGVRAFYRIPSRDVR